MTDDLSHQRAEFTLYGNPLGQNAQIAYCQKASYNKKKVSEYLHTLQVLTL
ncbi:hypothetical protein EaACW_3383 [Erwinia amylovora ACW56400]|uniref:Uncharacterized protein n=1 Tax=Erwinia amylovora (strain CFBP1430) TaxID=665029 RepID=D4I2T3_ERWAC|nr:hypothetical protein EaACW_3383 [Erwinia amylovora ACW56400]CBA23511.1 hypothetical protein predicted by Glimmer/Critica [Erwinia amylovora CFBP1430]CBJ44926.1 hypothetical protein EAM_0251 [Erwinia amylovora ATCC 49946]CCO80220.1 hypothetical protein BN432_3451 [Erwinia amylovora Ea356]CCO91576.1 hypothetical protein BN435_3434 [Erwinia amylovora 01SFR-BO]CCP00690.1 hypothetical protein BN438_3435 [Erwinia amylovora UPN527]